MIIWIQQRAGVLNVETDHLKPTVGQSYVTEYVTLFMYRFSITLFTPPSVAGYVPLNIFRVSMNLIPPRKRTRRVAALFVVGVKQV